MPKIIDRKTEIDIYCMFQFSLYGVESRILHSSVTYKYVQDSK